MSPSLPLVFAALGDPTRFAIVERLLAEGEVSAGAIADGLPISAPAVSRHLKVLHEAGAITRRVDKQRRLYAAEPATLQAISQWTQDHRAFWERSLDRLEAALARQGED